ncbi:hypothetical protein JSQ81_05395 [Sporosarcina sp. Marseille-Q4063]|uniref:hypothetical protein n=1 Tax=Sporosarcina sp. Marseille-Q4063 TaxID=2810514 RepID=UPI001BAEF1C8|nr:hypothetical protein [Sporosarcina sp. Marseille-Q4063]QUW23006.1 hypothetical protein JSQ81_05395 [Sporosarcina sp. Marseille-Q4063]
MNSWLMQNPDDVLPFKLIGFIFLSFWITVGFISYKFEKTPLKSAVIAHLPALLMLFFIIYQEVILDQYWANIFGLATQHYYLPLINIAAPVVSIFSFLIPGGMGIWLVSLIAFSLMFAAYYLGYYLKSVFVIKRISTI